MAGDDTHSTPLLKTPLHGLWSELGASFGPFAGYEMPIRFAAGVVAEHHQCRTKAALFDVSHMGQAYIGGASYGAAAKALEQIAPGDFQGLKPGQSRYSVFLNEDGGIIDDFIATRPAEPLHDGALNLVVNASRKQVDYALIRSVLPGGLSLTVCEDRALLAIQGPAARDVCRAIAPKAATLTFMHAAPGEADGYDCDISCSGYTGEDGFEISAPSEDIVEIARAFLKDDRVAPAGLGARDTLRLEAGLPLYGADLDESISPIEAGLAFAVSKARRERRDFPGASRIMDELESGPRRVRVGLKLEKGMAAREGNEIASINRNLVGEVSSGAPSPSLGVPIAMGYVPSALAEIGQRLDVLVRDKPRPAEVVRLPFTPARVVRKL